MNLKILCVFLILLYCLSPVASANANITGDKDANITDNDDAHKVVEKNNDKKLSKINLKVTTYDNYVGKNCLVYVYADKSFTGTVVATAGGEKTEIYVSKGLGIGGFDDLPAGVYDVKVTYHGEEAHSTLTVKKYDLNLKVNIKSIYVDDTGDATVELNTNKNFKGYLKVQLDNSDSVIVGVQNGYGHAKIKNLAPGRYSAQVIFDGDDKFNPDEASTTFEVILRYLKDPQLKIHVKDTPANENPVVEISADSRFTQTVNLEYNVAGKHKVLPVNIQSGHGNVTLDKLNPGTYTLKVSSKSDYLFKAYSAVKKLTITKDNPNLKISADDIVDGDNLTVKVDSIDGFKGKVKYRIQSVGGTSHYYKQYEAVLSGEHNTFTFTGFTEIRCR